MLKIGFTNKFFTLWNVTSEDIFSTIHTANGENHYKSGTRFVCNYIKNISFDLEKVKALFPGVEIDDELKGKKTSFDYSEGFSKTEYSNELFSIGRNKGKLISSFSEIHSLKWSFQSEVEEERISNIEKRLNELDVFFFQGSFGSREEVENRIKKQKKAKAEKLSVINELESGSAIIEPLFNLNEYGNIQIKGVCFIFENFKKMSYSGFDYALPTINGKGKKIKGKQIEVKGKRTCLSNYGFESAEAFLVNDFKIIN